ncbi:MAG: GNAT family N-acetyltransferase [Candidatus Cloacimonetes bacterium]|jgi:spermidine synthase|nr:GNAT family N-acetyltransferase [Candidatus Cloacimonadota bacterium]MDD2505770.1 GNAT family N-acetyltransferase [Candidatus Cloacimonadota bacterium]MDD4559192.1 GNAT family N-acetyltransferase [Candidatus Cloacimonadota bacterium]
MEDISYRIVKETDAARILELYRAAGWWQTDENPQYIETVKGIIANSFCFVIAKRGEEIIGMGRAISDGLSDAYIQDVTVWEAERGKGIGKGIIRELLRYLKEHKLQWIGLISEPGYEAFYGKLGFNVMKSYTPFLYSED